MKKRAGAKVHRKTVSEKRQWLYGPHCVSEALKAQRRKIYKIQFLGDIHKKNRQEIIALAQKKQIPWQKEALPKRPKDLSPNESGWVRAQVSPLPLPSLEDFLQNLGLNAPTVLLACDQIQDPQNLGALLRSFYALGGSHVLLCQSQAVSLTPTVSRCSAGASEHLTICQVGNLAKAIEKLKQRGYWVVLADAQGQDRLEDLPSPPIVIVLGNENRGVRPGISQKADLRIALPIRQGFDSLNVSACGAIFFYEMALKYALVRPSHRSY